MAQDSPKMALYGPVIVMLGTSTIIGVVKIVFRNLSVPWNNSATVLRRFPENCRRTVGNYSRTAEGSRRSALRLHHNRAVPRQFSDSSPGTVRQFPGNCRRTAGELSPKMAQDRHKIAQAGLYMARDSPKIAQDSPEMAQDGPQVAQDSPKMAQDGF